MQQGNFVEMSQATNQFTYFYLFYNTGSGGLKARQFNFLDLAELRLKVDIQEVVIKFVSVQNTVSRAQGLQALREDLNKYSLLPVITGGGDGTTMWIIELMLQAGIDIERVAIVPLPCGTGNDFSMQLGWGGEVPSDMLGTDYKILKQFVRQWLAAKISYFDIWDITMHTAEDGFISEIVKVGGNAVKQNLQDYNGGTLKIYCKKMANYLSIGVDARIGYGFDKRRTESQCMNKCCYCWEGFKKMFIHTKTVDQVIQFMEHYHPETKEQTTLFKTRECTNRDAVVIPGKPVNLVCLNINSYSAGTTNIWKNGKNPFADREFSNTTSYCDGLIEFFSFESIIGIGGEKLISGNATKLAQTSGPLVIQFKEESQLSTYYQVDGQYYAVTNPKQITVEPCKELKNGKIKVLVNR